MIHKVEGKYFYLIYSGQIFKAKKLIMIFLGGGWGFLPLFLGCFGGVLVFFFFKEGRLVSSFQSMNQICGKA